MFNDLLQQYRNILQHNDIQLGVKIDIITTKPLWGKDSLKVFARQPDILQKIPTYRGDEFVIGYYDGSQEKQFLNFINDLSPKKSFEKSYLEMVIKFPNVDRKDIYTFILLNKKCIQLMRKILSVDRETLLQTFPDIEQWLNDKSRKKLLYKY